MISASDHHAAERVEVLEVMTILFEEFQPGLKGLIAAGIPSAEVAQAIAQLAQMLPVGSGP
jgi:hypothetical protein